MRIKPIARKIPLGEDSVEPINFAANQKFYSSEDDLEVVAVKSSLPESIDDHNESSDKEKDDSVSLNLTTCRDEEFFEPKPESSLEHQQVSDEAHSFENNEVVEEKAEATPRRQSVSEPGDCSEENLADIGEVNDFSIFQNFQEIDVRGPPDEGVWSRKNIPQGTRYGPFIGKCVNEPIDPRYAWEVFTGPGAHGWLDGTLEKSNWLKYVRTVEAKSQINVKHFLLAGQIWYETCREIVPGEELLMGPRKPFLLHDMFIEPTGCEGDRETGSQHSENRKQLKSEDEDELGKHCPVCTSIFNKSDRLDEHLIKVHNFPADQYHCNVCPRAYAYKPCLISHQASHFRNGVKKKLYCETCCEAFINVSNLQRHIRTHHVGARSHACSECGKTFGTSSGLKQHTHIHSSFKPYGCEVCLKRYTQFSNLCRHRRMHANCRVQIKCEKCGQSFTTSTSLSKHKRFCDSTNPTTSMHQSPKMPLGNVPMASNNPYPFLTHRPALPFFPPNFNPYPSLFHPEGPNPFFFNNALLFANAMPPGLPQQPHEEPPKKIISPTASRVSNRMPVDNVSTSNDRLTPPRNTELTVKISPPTAEEASSHLRPSPVRPPPANNTQYVFNNPREQIQFSQVEVDETSPKDYSRSGCEFRNDSPVDRENSVDMESPVDMENHLPLDLSLCKVDETNVSCNEVTRTPSPERSSLELEKAQSSSSSADTIERPATELNIESMVESPPTPMAYPRPINPRLLEAMYRPQPNVLGFSAGLNERLLAPPVSSSFGPPRGFPFLSPLSQHQRLNFDLLRPAMPPGFSNVKQFQEVINPHSGGGKMKDRYACKYCAKVFPRSANLTRHLRTHTGEQPYKCKYCERSFSISSNLQRHVRNIHNKEKPFKCPLCERCFGQQTNLDRHLKKHETDDGCVVADIADSPGSSNENDREGYFDDIRSFMGKVACPTTDPYTPTLYSPPPHYSQPAIDVNGRTNNDENSNGFPHDLLVKNLELLRKNEHLARTLPGQCLLNSKKDVKKGSLVYNDQPPIKLLT